ncbi:MAG: fibronectin type III domain-containing protein, partial [Defluviitaleaceae bacterium]|nr:fibronectin type III domain-containing protein [Defluviitaleaceae bacterium]
VFADLEIEKWLEDEDENGNGIGTWQLFDDAVNPAVSALTGIVSDTTVGTPDEPGTGETAPSAPEVFTRDVEQMAASIHWSPYALSAAEIEDGSSIEWEFIRVQNGERMTVDEMNDRSLTLLETLRALENSPQKMGWGSDRRELTHIKMSPETIIHIEEKDLAIPTEANPLDGQEFRWRPNEVEFRDLTLLPNNLYFYYVRTIRIEESWDEQLEDFILIRSPSTWTEATVTTHPIQPPENLRQEPAYERAGYNGQTMALVSWAHPQMNFILEGMGEKFLFQYQIREGDDEWRTVATVPPGLMTRDRLVEGSKTRISFMVTGLQHSSIYQMRVRLYDVVAGDTSLWSNTITIATEINQESSTLDRQLDEWLNYLRRKLEEILRQPFWTAQKNSHESVLIYRPADVFDGLLESNPRTAIPLQNDGKNHTVYYLPTANIISANENRRGFSTAFSDLELLFAPSFLNESANQAVMDMFRAIDARGSELTDSFVRIAVDRHPLTQINGAPAITPSTTLSLELVATNKEIRNIRSWDRAMQSVASRIVESWLEDPVVRQGVRDMLVAEKQNEEISDHIYHVIDRIEAEIIRETNKYLTTASPDGILSHTRYTIREFNSPLHVVANVTANTSASGYRRANNNWQHENLIEYGNGRAFLTRAPGTFAFTGRVVDIPEIESVPRGNVAVGIVARYGLEDLFGANIDLQQNANRQMVVGAIARAAGVPRGSDAFAWANANLKVTLSSRNATGLISWQEAVAVTMALYEHRTSAPINTMRITNFQQTSAMNLDARYAQAVRAAFEIGIVSDASRNPAAAVTIGEFLDMLTLLNSKVRV